jgi:hypothetical protein
MAGNIYDVMSSEISCSTRFSYGTNALLVTIPVHSGYKFREGTDSGQVNTVKFTHISTTKRLGTTVRIIQISSTAIFIADIPMSRD